MKITATTGIFLWGFGLAAGEHKVLGVEGGFAEICV